MRRILVLILFIALAPAADRELTGTFSVRGAHGVTSGVFTALLDTDADVGWGEWRVYDRTGKISASGVWSARKLKDEWRGSWRVQPGTRGGQTLDMIGSWTANSALPPTAAVNDLIRSAAAKFVDGAWKTGDQVGDWAIQSRLP